ncbi:diacylglycerol kinase family enzyme [Pontibacter ummariensis]|uniref:Diacylglycerol kinase family enzyme n=1 Tax=Pontibacter ummariensis TaxID=1610492 RepID=A0A239FTL8_9BACT|nr:diacylglycerol kinase family protein [Pontibacter ummariensis]PRY11930.1 diacylglycerol kinase family enzyme [Pontibacter ummariensis]SNS60169.1 Diacylglycerol kinase family enzyme [Pontibacter ummariensis]
MDDEKKQQALLFVINPISGDIDKEELEEDIKAICKQHGIACAIYKTTGEKDKEHIREKLNATKYDGVFAIGGDGTVSIVASLLIGTTTPLGIIPLGSGNGLSKDLHVPQDTEEALVLIHRHVIRNIDTVSLNGVPSIHLSDLGFNALVVHKFCEGGTRGPGSYAWIAMQEYLGYAPKFYRIETDKEVFEGEAFMVTIANANAFGTNANINPNGILNDGRFEICLIEPFPKTAGISILYKLYTDSIDTSVYSRRLSCKSATIYNIDHEVMHIDGEPIDLGDTIKVDIHPRSLKVILPLPEDEE